MELVTAMRCTGASQAFDDHLLQRADRQAFVSYGADPHASVGRATGDAYVAEKYGTSPVRWLDKLGFLAADVTAAHCTQLDDEDARILDAAGTKIAHCPVATPSWCPAPCRSNACASMA
ncbi:hypothetical protein [Mesorhizobium sp. SP-1A]|uniref:hypothetical protein n=1 Tax=Mesorhizobium sp. SP-1A TaxID=3077840 RepID=UPI0028F70DA3|nr:hypothetical protein [Mesorhizobium sp. SP-1A]